MNIINKAQIILSPETEDKLLLIRLNHIDIESYLREELLNVLPHIISELVDNMYYNMEPRNG